RHAADHVRLEAGDLPERVDHRVQRIGDVDDERIGAVLLRIRRHVPHDLEVDLEQVLAAHARLARNAGGDDEDVGTGHVLPIGGAGDAAVVPVDRGELVHV